ncbi:MAG: glycosyltransferase family 9 protein [Candidatus Eisenbacteria bacterium]
MVRWGRMGDVLLAAAATRELRRAFPDALIDFAVKDSYREAAELLPGVDRVRTLSGGGITGLFEFRRGDGGRYDLVVDLHGGIRSRLLSLLLFPARVARHPRLSLSRRMLVRWKKGKGGAFPPVWRRYLAALEKIGIDVREEPPKLRTVEPGGTEGAVAFAPGAGRATKRWPASSYAAAIGEIAARTRRQVVLIGSGAERKMLEEIAAGSGTGARVLAGIPLAEAAAYLRRASLLVTNDSGLTHLACGAGTPVLAIFGPTSPELGFGPTGERDMILSVDLPCRPCSLHGTAHCPLPDRSHVCMTRIGPEEVARAAERILRDSGEGTG